MTSNEMKTMFHDFINEQIKIKQEKQFKVRLEFGMIVEIDVTAKDEKDAEHSANRVLIDKLYSGHHDGKMFCEVDDPDVYVASYGISTVDTEEVDYE